jgi:hypothetical protein
MEFEENNEEFEGKRTRNLKEKQREFFTRALFLILLLIYLC